MTHSAPSLPPFVKQRTTWYAACVGALGLAVAVSLQWPQIQQQRQQVIDPVEDWRQAQQRSSLLAAVGLTNVAADWLWLDFVQYFGDLPARLESGYGLSQDYLTEMTRLNPYLFEPYIYGMVALAWKQGQPRAAAELLREGTNFVTPEVNPLAYRLWYQIALVESLWLGNADAGQAAFDTAASWLEAVPTTEREALGIRLQPAGLRDLGERFASSPRSAQVRFDIWLQVWGQTNDREVRRLIIEQLDSLGAVRQLPDGSLEFVRPTAEAEIAS